MQLVAKKAIWHKFGNFAKNVGNKALKAAQNPELQQLALHMLGREVTEEGKIV